MYRWLPLTILFAVSCSGESNDENGDMLGNHDQENHIQAIEDLRQMILTGKYTDFGLDVPAHENEAWGIMMENGFAEGSFSLTCFSDGNTSLYYSSGGGIIGAGQHENVKSEAIALVELTDAFINDMTPVSEFAHPAAGFTVFYVMTDSGVFSIAVPEEDLGEDRHKLAPLFYKAHDVITEIRKVTDL